MIAKELKSQYKKIISEIKYIHKRLEYEQSKEYEIVAIKATGSSREFPYLPTSVIVEAEEPNKTSKSMDKIIKLNNELERLIQERKMIEDKIDNIQEVDLREIIWMYCIEGKTHSQIAMEMGFARTSISKKMNLLTFT